MEKDFQIIAQVVFKGFVDMEHRLPATDEDAEKMRIAIQKVWRAGLMAQKTITGK